jgi:hypothetical protein
VELTADKVLDALTVCAGKSAARPDEIVELVRRAEPGLAVTLFSAWEAGGTGLSSGLRGEVEAVRHRMDFYRSVTERIRSKVPGVTFIKGLEVADLYPAGIVRNMTDIDVIAPSESVQWDIIALLMQDGWQLDAGSILNAGGDLRMLISMIFPHEDRYQPAYSAEIEAVYSVGNLAGIPPVVSLPPSWQVPAIKNMLMLLNERYEQPFRARDLIDSALLYEQLSGAEVAILHKAVAGLCLAVEYHELAGLVQAAGLATLPPLPGGARAIADARARRFARQASFMRSPLIIAARALRRRQMLGRAGRAGDMLWGMLAPKMSVISAVRAGMVAFGLPLEGPLPNVTSAVLRHRDAMTWVDTPVGRFLLTIGNEVPQSAIDELSAPATTSGKEEQ